MNKKVFSLFPFVIPLEVVLEGNANYGGLSVIQPSVFDKTTMSIQAGGGELPGVQTSSYAKKKFSKKFVKLKVNLD